jgi:hypothetical protein
MYHTEELLDVLGFSLCYADTVTMIPLFTVVTTSAKKSYHIKQILNNFCP